MSGKFLVTVNTYILGSREYFEKNCTIVVYTRGHECEMCNRQFDGFVFWFFLGQVSETIVNCNLLAGSFICKLYWLLKTMVFLHYIFNNHVFWGCLPNSLNCTWSFFVNILSQYWQSNYLHLWFGCINISLWLFFLWFLRVSFLDNVISNFDYL